MAERAPCTCAPNVLCAACQVYELQAGRSAAQIRRPPGAVLNRTLVAEAVKNYRRRHHLTLRETAARVGLSFGTLCDLEHRRVFRPSLQTLALLHERIGIPKKQLFIAPHPGKERTL